MLTLIKILLNLNYKIKLCISEKIFSLIKNDLKNIDIDLLLVSNSLSIKEKKEVFNYFFINKISLLIFPSYSIYRFKDIFFYRDLLIKYNNCVGVFNYEKWFNIFPQIQFNEFLLPKRSTLISWLGCQFGKKYIKNFFISEIHINSENPLKKKIKKTLNIDAFDIPFKISSKKFSPNLNYNTPVFIIPGGINNERRDYDLVLNYFYENYELIKNHEWRLILLGKPYRKYGRKIIEFSERINNLYDCNKIVLFNSYIPKSTFDEWMEKSTHIIAPINKDTYRNGKDSGAIYDFFYYSKIGIIDKDYFYNNKLPEQKILLKFGDNNEFTKLMNSIIFGQINYNYLKKELSKFSDFLSLDKWSKHLDAEFKIAIKNK